MDAYHKKVGNTGLSQSFQRFSISPLIKELKGNRCELCYTTQRLENHHTDYTKQTIYTIKLLCKKCHNWVRKNKVKCNFPSIISNSYLT